MYIGIILIIVIIILINSGNSSNCEINNIISHCPNEYYKVNPDDIDQFYNTKCKNCKYFRACEIDW